MAQVRRHVGRQTLEIDVRRGELERLLSLGPQSAGVVAVRMRDDYRVQRVGIDAESAHVAKERGWILLLPVRPDVEEDALVVGLDQVGDAGLTYEVVLFRVPIDQGKNREMLDGADVA